MTIDEAIEALVENEPGDFHPKCTAGQKIAKELEDFDRSPEDPITSHYGVSGMVSDALFSKGERHLRSCPKCRNQS